MTQIDFKFPFSIKNGSLQVVADRQSLLEQQILSIILTKKGERVMRAGYGTDELLFNSSIDIPNLIQSLYQSLSQIKNIRVLSNLTEDGIQQLQIYYTTEENDRETLFFAEI